MKQTLVLFLLLSASVAVAQINCNDSTNFFGYNGTRPIPPSGCPAVYLITDKHRKAIFIEKDKSDSTLRLLKKINQDLSENNTVLKQMVKVKDRHIDSLNTFYKDRTTQSTQLDSVARASVKNTEKAVRTARTYKTLTFVTLIGAVIAIILIAI